MATVNAIIFNFSGIITYTDDTIDQFSVVLDDQGNIYGNDLNFSDDIIRSLDDKEAIEHILEQLTNRYVVEAGSDGKVVSSLVASLSGRVTYDDGTIEDFGTTLEHVNPSQEDIHTNSTGSLEVFSDILSSSFITLIDETLSKLGIVPIFNNPDEPGEAGLLYGWEFNDAAYDFIDDLGGGEGVELNIPVEINSNNGSAIHTKASLTGTQLKFYSDIAQSMEAQLPDGNGFTNGDGLGAGGITTTNGIKFFARNVTVDGSGTFKIYVTNYLDYPTNPASDGIATEATSQFPIGLGDSISFSATNLRGNVSISGTTPCNIPIGTYDVIVQHLKYIDNPEVGYFVCTITNNSDVTVTFTSDFTALNQTYANVAISLGFTSTNPNTTCTVDSFKIYDVT